MQLVPHEKMIEIFVLLGKDVYGEFKGGRKLQRIKKINKYYSVRCRNTIIKKNTKIPYEMEIGEAEYQEEVLTDHFEMHIISLPEAIKEYDKNKDDKVLQ